MHFLFLGLFASGFCFISWTYAIQKLGAVPTSQFIYLVPFITTMLSVVFLHERLSLLQVLGMLCILFAVIFSQDIFKSPIVLQICRTYKEHPLDGVLSDLEDYKLERYSLISSASILSAYSTGL